MSVLVTVFNLAIDLFEDPEFLMAIVMDSVDIDLFVDFSSGSYLLLRKK